MGRRKRCNAGDETEDVVVEGLTSMSDVSGPFSLAIDGEEGISEEVDGLLVGYSTGVRQDGFSEPWEQ